MRVWKEQKLGSLIKIKHGFAFKGEFFSDSGNFVLLTPGNIFPEGGIKLKGEKEKYYLGEFPVEYLMKKNDLLVVMTDLTQTASILGGAMLIPEDGKYLHNQRLGLVTIKDENELDKRFLYCYLNWQYFRDQVKGSSNGATVKHTSPDRIYKCKINLPPLPVQQKIAAILSAYDDLIENNNKRIGLLEKAAEEIYREWFVRMRFPGWQQVKFVKGIPADWEVIKVADAFEFLGGGTPSTTEKRYWDDGTVNWFTPSDITKANGIFLPESIDKCTEEGLNNSSARMFPAYSVMMTSRATIGAVGVNTTPACTNQGFITCIPNENYPLTFLYHWLKLNKSYFEILATGSTFAELTKGTFKKIKILKPKKELVEQYESKVHPMFKEMEFLLQEVDLLKKSRDLLLPRLISGKLSVEALDFRFPPSMIAQ